MTKNPFGWDYPPGAANDPSAPYNQDPDDCLTQLQDDIFKMLEKAGLSEGYIAQIMELIRIGEEQRQNAEDAALVDELAEAERLEQEEREYLEDREEKDRE